ncbi:HopJ type III effector protein [Mucilaginibacter mallensis]|uniref:HopJ type III effector protein n=1 Tax=Mucilaginibacter mallensis TaxID=652787 RepID=A0A1H1SEQ7_MUCMA|nr:HopJ type III effector protein [Mucilaginibacter mallensis]SDS46411.1 HopJ type III effector protein [Mucilaginibacter mallensis]
MKEQLLDLITASKSNSLAFNRVIEFIGTYYQHQPAAFKNGDAYNESTQNQGSAKIFAFARINSLSEADTLYLFAEHYHSVLANPLGTDHQNIRQFMAHGWAGVFFESDALILK